GPEDHGRSSLRGRIYDCICPEACWSIRESLTARAGPYMYLPNADKYRGLTRRPLQEQKGLDERALMASQRPSAPWGSPRSEPCGRTSPTQALSSGGFPPPGLLTPLLAAATAAPERATLHAASTPDRSVRLPLLGHRAATAWPSRCRW